ncbi:hypothetical protein MKW98_029559 [Papaver atlanticum]|uniref:histidine kinase n=1 Tax=Papaver atlanticum TaxID=357466 RepID=A0AAD4S4Q3_9MAGN|nr:hypothetical protein MKW98_029559 [Papaver atlanticum]
MAIAKAKKTEPNETKETTQASQSLAHDIRTLLTEVVSLAKILSNSDLDQKQRQLLDAIMSYGESAFQLINDTVDHSKIELEMDMEVPLSSMWPEALDVVGRKFNIEKPRLDQGMSERIANTEDALTVDFKRLYELTSYSEKGSIQLNNLVKSWEQKQNNAVRRIKEERAILIKPRQEIELKKLDIQDQEEHRFDEASLGDKRPVSIFEGDYDVWEAAPRRRLDIVVQEKRVEVDAAFDTVKYWKLKAKQLEKWLEESLQREQALEEKLQENIKLLETQASPVEELSQVLKRADNFLHFVLQNAPIVMGHQDNELRYRFIFNHFPGLSDEDIIGKTDLKIFSGSGIQESYDFKKEVMKRGRPAKQEITFGTELFRTKIFSLHAEPVFNISGDTIGVNYVGMDISDQVIRREKMAKLPEQIAVEEDKKAELDNNSRNRGSDAKQSLAHDIRPLLTEDNADHPNINFRRGRENFQNSLLGTTSRPYHILNICLNLYLFLLNGAQSNSIPKNLNMNLTW